MDTGVEEDSTLTMMMMMTDTVEAGEGEEVGIGGDGIVEVALKVRAVVEVKARAEVGVGAEVEVGAEIKVEVKAEADIKAVIKVKVLKKDQGTEAEVENMTAVQRNQKARCPLMTTQKMMEVEAAIDNGQKCSYNYYVSGCHSSSIFR